MTEPSPTQYIPPGEPEPTVQPDADAGPLGSFKQTSGMAITALVLGICGLVICPLVLSIPAIVFGALAMKDIDRNKDQLDGKGMAIAGFVTGIVGTSLWTLIIVIAIAIGVAEENDSNDNREYFNPPPGREYNLD